MNCREFRRKHDAYVDDTVSGVEREAMERHRQLCARCARLDTRVRRALLLVRNLPPVELSRGFDERLRLRLIQERALIAAGRAVHGSSPLDVGGWRPLSMSTYTAIAAGLLAVVGLATTMGLLGHSEPSAIRLAPVVASLPEPEPSALATPAMVASMPAGMPVWPAVFVAQQAPWHLASEALEH
jgi:anti-sigma factor RsiW